MTFAVTQANSTKTPRELLTSPVSALIGIQLDAEQFFRKLGIVTVRDLAEALLFEIACSISNLEQTEVPRDRVTDSAALLPASELPSTGVENLRLLADPLLHNDAKTSLGITTIRELSLYPPYREAKAISLAAAPSERDDDADAAPPSDLVPTSGQYPIERVQYEVLVLDQSDLQEGTDLNDAGQLELVESAAFYPVQGALLTWTQSWYTQGLGLGQLLHSLALAPGESTRIAMIDWRRRQRSQGTESISENEALVNDLSRTRSISEVTKAVATEAQTGFSNSVNTFEGGQIGGAMGGSVAGGYGGEGYSIQGAGGHGISAGYAAGTSETTSISWTTGQRDISASLAQQIADRTHQASSMTRSRWATIVKEVSQEESEQISTRSVTNFNHMHAMTVQYWETVQMYRVAVELTKVDAALFIPMALLTFDIATIVRYRQEIAAVGLNAEIRALANAEPGWVAITSPNRVMNIAGHFWTQRYLNDWQLALDRPIAGPVDATVVIPQGIASNFGFGFWDDQLPIVAARVYWREGTMTDFGIEDRTEASTAWSPRFAATVGDMFNSGSGNGLDFSKIRRIAFRKKADMITGSYQGQFALTFTSALAARADVPQMVLAATIRIPGGVEEFTAFDFDVPYEMSRILNHLNQNREHYSRAIWAGLSATTIFSLLRSYTWKGKPVVSQIDPLPISTAGNYMVFRLHPARSEQAAQEWQEFLAERDIRIGERKETIVPMPSGGVFAEAVLGRANSAEKLDITRFWNWQDSPIPIVAPDITAIQSGTRATPEDPQPGSTPAPVLNIMNAPSMPDPTGMTAVLSAIQNGNMFRDMSGLVATIAATQAGLTRGFDASTAAGTQAAQNFKTAADLLSSYMNSKVAAIPGAQNSSGDIKTNPSNSGALINHGKSLDQRSDSNSPQTDNSGNSSQNENNSSTTSPGGNGDSNSDGANGASSHTNEQRAFESVLGSGPSTFPEMLLRSVMGSQPNERSGPSNVTDDRGRQYVRQAVIDEARASPRVAKSLDYLLQQGWQIRKTAFNSGSRGFWIDQSASQLLIDEHDEDIAISAQRLGNAVKLAFVNNDDMRRKHERRVAIVDYFPGEQNDDLLAMGNLYKWTAWFWTLESDEGQVSTIIKDMCFVLAGRDNLNMLQSVDDYYAFGTGRGRARSGGFNARFIDDGNQVRHAAASLHASFHMIGMYFVAQTRELNAALLGTPEEQNAALADISLNVFCDELATEIKDRGISGVGLGDAIIAKFR